MGRGRRVTQLEWYRFLLEQAAQAWLLLRVEDWRVVEASEAAARMLGLPLEQLRSLPLPGFRRLYKLLQQKTSESHIRAEAVLSLPDGRTHVVQAQARLASFRGTGYLWILLLGTEQEQGLVERLVLTDKLALLGQLLVGVAHEIRNPLAAIQLNLHVVKSAIPEDAAWSSSVEMALQGAQRIAELIETTLNFARPAPQVVQRHDVHEILEAALKLIQMLLYRKSVTLRRYYATEPLPVYGDARQLQQVFVNLLTNAADAIEEQGSITLSTTHEELDSGRYVVVSIADDGVGIPPEDLAHIFEPFFTRKPHGTGLGLAIARRILLQHRGELLIESRPGHGTQCIVRLPAAGEAGW